MSSYVTLAEVKAYLGVTSTTDDALLEDFILKAESMVNTRCKRVFVAASDATRYFDAIEDVSADLLTLYLDHDLCAITSITNGDGTTVTAGQYVTEPRNDKPYYAIRLRLDASISWTYNTTPENAVTVVGRWAYGVSVPDDIRGICTRLAVYLYRQKDNSADSTADRAIMSASGTVLLPNKLANDFYEVTAPYIRKMG